MLEELVQRDLRDRVALQLDLDPHPGPVGVVGERSEISVITLSCTRSAIFLITPDSPPFFTPYGSSVTMIADLPPRSSSMWARAHDDPAAAGAVRVADPLAAEHDRPGREVGALHVLHQVVDVRLRLVDQLHDRVDDLASRCGGMFVAIPTAIPAEPFTSRFGKRDGSTVGSRRDSS